MTQQDWGNTVNLVADDLELFAYMLEEEGIESSAPSTITPRKSTDEPRLSFAQERLWFIDQIEPGQPTYNIPFALRLNGRLKVAVLERTLTEIVRRHEVLRTTFITGPDGAPALIAATPAPFKLTILDLSALPQGDREVEALHLAKAEAQRGFDLAQGPLLRVTLLRLADEEHIALVTLHHIVSDGWSTGVFIREVAALYAAFSAGEQSPLAELGVQYVDYAVWQREWLSGAVLDEQLSYWREQLGGELAVLDLPTDRPRPPVQTFRGARQTFQLPVTVQEGLQRLGREEGATLFMTLLTAYQVLLQRYTGAGAVAVGTPIAGRNRAEIEGLIGFFVNTLVLRTEFKAEESFRKLLRRVRENVLSALAHQDLPFQKLVEALQPGRDLSHTPLFQAWFVLQTAPLEPLQFPELTFTPLSIDSGIAQFDLSLDITESPHGMSAMLMYNTDLFDHDTIGRMIGHFRTLLESVIASPDQSIRDLRILPTEEANKLLTEWNDTASQLVGDSCVHELFQRQSELTPDNVAVVFGAEELTYAELNRRANKLANYLRELGVGPETLVGICIKRSVEMVVGILGVLKAGGAYVPLDHNYPFERLAFMLQDTDLPVLLTQEELEDRIPSGWTQVVCLDSDWDKISQQPDVAPSSDVSGEDLAYVIYTSGSTGKPKGVMISHQHLTNYLDWCVRDYKVDQGIGSLVHSSIAFDLTITSLFPALITGRRIVLVDDDDGIDGLANALLDAEHYSLVKITPAHLEILKQALPEQKLDGRTDALIIGGEALMWQTLTHWRQHAPHTRLINEYGPTETVVGCCVYEVGSEVSESGGVPIGRPISNTQLYILDERQMPVPIGLRGELFIGGAGVGRGYLNQPEQTAEKFIPDVFGGREGARLYASGDLARYLPNGNIEYLGRTDEQVKLRGYRIELAEIKAALETHPKVSESVVVLREDVPGDQRLVGYVVLDSEEAVSAAELQRYLKGKLPDYEVPSALEFLEQLPLTINGKVDHEALPAPALTRSDITEFVGPRTRTEETLARIWAEVLHLERIGVRDNFFDLGGHSLLAVQVISRIRGAFQLEMAVRDIFEAPTVDELAGSIEGLLNDGQSQMDSVIKPVSRDQLLPLSFAQQRLWFVHQLDPASPAYNLPAAIRMSGQLNVAALQQTITEIVRRHESLRTTFDVVDGQLVQIIRLAETVEIPIIDLTAVPEIAREPQALRIAMAEAQRGFDLAQGPLLRVTLLRLADEEHIALVTLHHIVSDGWSTGVFIREVAALYAAFSAGEQSPLAELGVQYVDYAVWQREWLSGAVLDEQLSYWREQLGGDLAVLDLPTDRPRPPVQTFRGARQTFQLPVTVQEGLQRLGREEGATLFMTLLTAYQVLLQRYTGAGAVAVGTPIAGRNRAEIEGLIGFFVNTLVLRTEFKAEESFRELLRSVRENVLSAFAHQDLPFEKLVEELQPARDMSRAPLAQVFFTMENAQHDVQTLPGLTLTPMECDAGTVKYDLVLSMVDTGIDVRGTLDYNVDLFEPETIVRLVEHYQTLLHSIAENADERVSKLELLTKAEREQVVSEWNETKAGFHSEDCIHHLFETQVSKSPDATAVVSGTEQLSYAELNSRANQLAHHLRALGVGPESRVGLCVERSLELAVGLLGILKAGGAYVPLDPAYPSERLSFMVVDSQCGVLLTQQHLLESLPQHDARVICLDRDWDLVAQETDEQPPHEATAFNLAYVIYTSGSTGRPKGTLLEHRGLCNMVEAQIAAFGVHAESRVLQFASLSFDASVSEVFMAWLAGAALYLEKAELLLPGPTLSEILHTRGITTVTFPPALLATMPAEDFPSLSTIIVAGEACSPEVLATWSTGRRFFNAYGPTESTVCATINECSRSDGSPPIGRPIRNIQVYIVDQNLEPVPVGVPGELCIGGVGLARGYHGRPDLTAQKFIPNPFADEPGARLYRSGDLARFLPDGQIEFLGRIDQQIKIRGFRVELGEIEAALQEYSAVKESVVIAREDNPGDVRLVAYLVAEPLPTASQLRSHLKEKLPEYMIPSAFIMLEALPLTANGKVDRRALPAPDSARPDAGDFVAPRTNSEKEIAAIWEKVLKMDHVGVYDNFFELGGHSLLMIQVRNKLEEDLQRKVSVPDLFKYPTVSTLARFLDEEVDEDPLTTSSREDRMRRRDTSQRQARLERRSLKQNEEGLDE